MVSDFIPWLKYLKAHLFFLRYVLGYIDKLLKHGEIVKGERYVQGCFIVFMVFAVLLLW